MSLNTAHLNDFQIPSIRVILGQQAEKPNPIKGRLPKSEKTKKTFSVEGDRVTLSEEAKKALFQQKSAKTEEKKSLDGTQLDAGEKREVQSLRKRDAQVRRHEMAHKMAGGSITGQIVYEYESGPDGKRYASAGHISIDTSTESTPEATLRKASSIRRAALAPSDPSPADRRVAGKAQRMASRARQDITEERQEAMAEQMERINNSLSSGDSGIDINLSALGGIQLNIQNPFQQRLMYVPGGKDIDPEEEENEHYQNDDRHRYLHGNGEVVPGNVRETHRINGIRDVTLYEWKYCASYVVEQGILCKEDPKASHEHLPDHEVG